MSTLRAIHTFRFRQNGMLDPHAPAARDRDQAESRPVQGQRWTERCQRRIAAQAHQTQHRRINGGNLLLFLILCGEVPCLGHACVDPIEQLTKIGGLV